MLLGTGHADGDFRSMTENAFKDDPDVRLLMLYSDALAHLIYAASDTVLVPSLFEPCGLTQTIAILYGALPVVPLTGGLADTIHGIDLRRRFVSLSHSSGEDVVGGLGNGFGFTGVDDASLDGCLGRALEMFGKEPRKRREVSVKNMGLGFSWVVSVQSHRDLYNSIAAIQSRRNADYRNLSVRGWTIAAVAVSDIGMLMAFLEARQNHTAFERTPSDRKNRQQHD